MNYKSTVLTALLLFLATAGFGQNSIVSDRPGFTFSSSTMGGNLFQYQGGLTFSSPGASNNYLWENDFRYGLTDRFEVDATLSYQVFSIPDLNISADGVNMFRIGTRYQFLNSGESAVDLTGIVQYDFLQLSNEVGTNFNRLRAFGSLSYNDLGENVSLNFNLGLSTIDVGGGQEIDPFYTVNLGVGLSDRTSIYVEHFGEEFVNVFNYGFTGGFAYLAKPQLQLDIYGGVTDNSFSSGTGFGSIGVSYLFN